MKAMTWLVPLIRLMSLLLLLYWGPMLLWQIASAWQSIDLSRKGLVSPPYVPMGMMLAAHAIPCGVGIVLLLRTRSVARWLMRSTFPPNCCQECGYSLDGLADRACPECGVKDVREGRPS